MPVEFKKCTLAAILFLLSTATYAVDVIVNSSLDISTTTQSQLRSIFTMKVKRWNNNTPVKVFIMGGDSELHRKFCLQTLEVFPYQLQRIWDVMLFSGTGTIPVEVKDEAAMLEKVSNTPGAIGYILDSKGEIPNVKTLRLQTAP